MFNRILHSGPNTCILQFEEGGYAVVERTDLIADLYEVASVRSIEEAIKEAKEWEEACLGEEW